MEAWSQSIAIFCTTAELSRSMMGAWWYGDTSRKALANAPLHVLSESVALQEWFYGIAIKWDFLLQKMRWEHIEHSPYYDETSYF